MDLVTKCLAMAGTFRDREARIVLSHMAEVWLRLAERNVPKQTSQHSSNNSRLTHGRRQRVGRSRLAGRLRPNENPAQGMGSGAG